MQHRSFLTNFARANLQTLNLRRFFGDYRTFAFDPDYFHLGIGEIANITDDATWQRILQDFDSDPRVVSRAIMYSGTRGEHAANQAMAVHVGACLGVQSWTSSTWCRLTAGTMLSMVSSVPVWRPSVPHRTSASTSFSPPRAIPIFRRSLTPIAASSPTQPIR